MIQNSEQRASNVNSENRATLTDSCNKGTNTSIVPVSQISCQSNHSCWRW